MISVNGQVIISLSCIVLALALLCMRYDPQRLHGRLLRKSIAGLALLIGWNLVSGMELGVNPLSALTAGALGLPGIGLLSVMAMLP